MALANNFNQKYIDGIDANNIPKEFIDYFNRQTAERKMSIIESRPDIAEKLGMASQEDTNNSSEITENMPSVSAGDEEVDEFLAKMSENPYDSMNLYELQGKHLDPIVLYTIPEKQEKCKIHKKAYEKLQFRCQLTKTYGYVPFYCKDCNRLYINPPTDDFNMLQKFADQGMEYTYYDLDATSKYIRSQIKDIEITGEDTIYIPDVWIFDNPKCPVHGDALETQRYVLTYKGKKLPFEGHFCDKCNKPILSKAKAEELEELCAVEGFKFPNTEVLAKKIKPAKIVNAKKIKPHYIIEDGKIKPFNFDKYDQIVDLKEEDTVVVSEGAYCNYDGHISENTIAMFTVKAKRDSNKKYVFLGGFCPQCQKYYMAEDDYNAVYPIGRPLITTIVDLEDKEYRISSGEVFQQEDAHLKSVEGSVNGEIMDIHRQPDYVDQYATETDYDSISRLQWEKKESREKYGERLEKLSRWTDKPYTYRVDIFNKEKSITFYIGTEDIEINGISKVISFNNNFGRKLVNERTTEIEFNGQTYNIKLVRDFDISSAVLYSYANIKTDEDSVFRAGITDPFLIRVLKMRKKQHNLVDIMVSIQENQNTIVDAAMNENLIVQGCAGSGKTMVLLHRLSNIKYNYPHEFKEKTALILTPNRQFNLHISGLADSLQIGRIDKMSVQEYIASLLEKYSKEFSNKNKVLSEVAVNQDFVNYIYSDSFLDKFYETYDQVMSERKDVLIMLSGLAEVLEDSVSDTEGILDCDFIPTITKDVSRFSRKANSKKNAFVEARRALKRTQKSIEDQAKYVEKANEIANGIVEKVLPDFRLKIDTALAGWDKEVKEAEKNIAAIEAAEEKLQNQIFAFGKAGKLEEFKKQKTNEKRTRTIAFNKFDEIKKLYDESIAEKTDEEIVAWMRHFILQLPGVRTDINRIEDAKKKQRSEQESYEKLVASIPDLEKRMVETEQAVYPDEVYKSIEYLSELMGKSTDLAVFKSVFKRSVTDYLSEKGMARPKGTHRYDLYIQLWFCMKYYGKKLGTSEFICVDEAQDVAVNTYRLIYEVNNKKVTWNLYGDTNQLLKPGRGINNWSKLVKTYDMNLFYLNENYRNTNQITRYCNDSFNMNVAQTGVDGPSVGFISRSQLESKLAELKVNSERVAIIIPRVVKKSEYLHMDMLPASVRDIIGDTIDNGRISYVYVDEVKGIEFDKVFVVPNNMKRNEKYIAYTRALYELTIVDDIELSGKNSLVDEEADAIFDDSSDDELEIEKPDIDIDAFLHKKDDLPESVQENASIEASSTLLLNEFNDDAITEKLKSMTVGYTARKNAELGKDLFRRLEPEYYTRLARILCEFYPGNIIKGIFTRLEESLVENIRKNVDFAALAYDLLERDEVYKLGIIATTLPITEDVCKYIPNVSRADALIKLNTEVTLNQYVDEFLEAGNDKVLLEFIRERISTINGNFIAKKCVLILKENADLRYEALELLKEGYKKSEDLYSRSLSFSVLIDTAIKIHEQDFDVVKEIVKYCTKYEYSPVVSKRYAQEEPADTLLYALKRMAKAKISSENMIYLYLNTKMREDLNFDRFMTELIALGYSEEELVSEIKDVWLAGTIKHVQGNVVRVAANSISAIRLLVFDPTKEYIVAANGEIKEPVEGDVVYFKIAGYDHNEDLFSINSICELNMDVH